MGRLFLTVGFVGQEAELGDVGVEGDPLAVDENPDAEDFDPDALDTDSEDEGKIVFDDDDAEVSDGKDYPTTLTFRLTH